MGFFVSVVKLNYWCIKMFWSNIYLNMIFFFFFTVVLFMESFSQYAETHRTTTHQCVYCVPFIYIYMRVYEYIIMITIIAIIINIILTVFLLWNSYCRYASFRESKCDPQSRVYYHPFKLSFETSNIIIIKRVKSSSLIA